MTRRPPLGPAAIARLCELREAGWTYRAIAAELGCSRSGAEYHCRRLGAEPPGPPPAARRQPPLRLRHGRPVRAFTAAEDAALTGLAAAGRSRSEIARRLGRAVSSVRVRLATIARAEERAGQAGAAE